MTMADAIGRNPAAGRNSAAGDLLILEMFWGDQQMIAVQFLLLSGGGGVTQTQTPSDMDSCVKRVSHVSSNYQRATEPLR